MKQPRHTSATTKGVTLIELIMAIIIVGILTAVSSMYIKETINLWRFLSFRNEVVSQGRVALSRMEREMRQAKDTSLITAADVSRFSFSALDLDGDGNDDTVEFYRDAGVNELRRVFNGSPAQGDILASGAAELTFHYYKQDGTELTALPLDVNDRALVFRITITLNIQSGTQSKTLRTQVYPRNL